jgi:nucleotide-binding universal stress UspA family protein
MPYTPALREFRKSREDQLEQFAVDHFNGLPYSTRMEDGEAGAVIDWLVRVERADLVIMPSKGLGKFRRMLLGSITAKVLHDVACPVLTSAHTLDAAPIPVDNLRSIVCGVELHAESDRVLGVAASLAQVYRAHLAVVHMEPASASAEEEYAHANALDTKLRRSLVTAGAGEDAGKVSLLETGVEQGIRLAVRAENADLVIVGRGHERETIGRIWSHLYAIVRESPCPVLSV